VSAEPRRAGGAPQGDGLLVIQTKGADKKHVEKYEMLPVMAKGPYGYEKVNAADQRRDPESLLNWTERMIRIRKEVPDLGWADFEILETKNKGVLAVRYRWRNNSVLTLHNLTGDDVETRASPRRRARPTPHQPALRGA
jgi:glycosidase